MGVVSDPRAMSSLVVLASGLALASAQSNFRCPERDGYFPDPVQCDKYYDCLDDIPEDRLCPDGLAFDPFSRKREPCDYYFNVDCGDRLDLQPPEGPQRPVPPPERVLLPPRPQRVPHLLRMRGRAGRGVHLLLRTLVR